MIGGPSELAMSGCPFAGNRFLTFTADQSLAPLENTYTADPIQTLMA